MIHNPRDLDVASRPQPPGFFEHGHSADTFGRNEDPTFTNSCDGKRPMLPSAKIAAFAALSALFVAGALASGAAAQQTPQRCSGTLCDIYYGSPSPAQEGAAPAAAPAAATPLTAPSSGFLSNMFSGSSAAPAQGSAAPAPQRSSFFNVGGGGLTGGNRDGECGGTICDLFHGHSSASDNDAPLSQSQSGTPQSRFSSFTAAAEPPEPVAMPVAAPAAAPAPAGSAAAPQGRVAYRAPPPKPSCVPRAGDPWSCYRH